MLRRDAPYALVVGSADRPWRLRAGGAVPIADRDALRAFTEPGYVLIAASFERAPVADGTRFSTETRVQPTDAVAPAGLAPTGWRSGPRRG